MNNKLFVFISVWTLIFTGQSFCMLSTWQYEPKQSPSTPSVAQYRDKICFELINRQLKVDGINITSITPLTGEDAKYQCNQYAFKKTLGKVPGSPFLVIDNYFRQVRDPKPGDFVFYTMSKADLRGTHVAFIDKDGAIKSKWGNEPDEIGHDLFATPDIYGNAAGFFRFIAPYDTKKQACIDFMNRDGEIMYCERLRDCMTLGNL